MVNKLEESEFTCIYCRASDPSSTYLSKTWHLYFDITAKWMFTETEFTGIYCRASDPSAILTKGIHVQHVHLEKRFLHWSSLEFKQY